MIALALGAGLSGAVAVVPSSREPGRLIDFVTSVLGEFRRFRVVERARLEEVLKEQELWASKAVSDSAAVEVGRLLGAKYACVVSKVGWELTLRFVDVETGLVERVVVAKGWDWESLRESLIEELRRVFRSEARAVAVRGKYLALDVGRDEGVFPGSFYAVLEPKTKRRVGLVRVDDAFWEGSAAQLVRGKVWEGAQLVECPSPKAHDLALVYSAERGAFLRVFLDKDYNLFGPELLLGWEGGEPRVEAGALKGISPLSWLNLYASAGFPATPKFYGFKASVELELGSEKVYALAEAGFLWLVPWTEEGEELRELLRAGLGFRF